MPRRFDDHDFQCRPCASLDQMTAMRRRIRLSQHDMRMDFRFVIFSGDVSRERQHFDLFVDRASRWPG